MCNGSQATGLCIVGFPPDMRLHAIRGANPSMGARDNHGSLRRGHRLRNVVADAPSSRVLGLQGLLDVVGDWRWDVVCPVEVGIHLASGGVRRSHFDWLASRRDENRCLSHAP